MDRKVVISRTAEQKLENLFEYLVENWSLKVKSEFVKKLDKTIEIIQWQPETFPASEIKPDIRKCVLTKHNTIYYRFDSKEVKILTVFDNRQNPEKLKKEL